VQSTIIDAPNTTMNRLALADNAAHDWYRFVLSYPAHLVRHYLEQFGADEHSVVLDPFCGTGTTIVEAKKLGFTSIGVESHPMTHFASSTKVDWTPDPVALLDAAEAIAEIALKRLSREGLVDTMQPRLMESPPSSEYLPPLQSLPDEAFKLLLKDSISPLPLHKTISLLEAIDERADPRFAAHLRLALAKALVFSISNLHFGPEVGIGKPKAVAPVIEPWLANVRAMAADLEVLQAAELNRVSATVLHADSREALGAITPGSVDMVICSPPYPNEKDYTRTTRLETVLLGYASSKADLQRIKRGLVRSNTRTVYIGDTDDEYVAAVPEIQRIAAEIERRRIELGKTSGFERMYHRVTKLYFGGMARHFAELRGVLKPGAHLAYVVGDQASYLGVHVATGNILSAIAAELGYEVVGLDLFRTRRSTANRQILREEVLILRWP
jgi:DNA modification methylase